MNSIKFRGKSIETNEWVVGNLVNFNGRPFIVGDFVEVTDEYTILEWWEPVYDNSVSFSTWSEEGKN